MITVTLRVIGAGQARTRHRLAEARRPRTAAWRPCYDMFEVFPHPAHIPVWHQAARGILPDWRMFLDGYRAAVDLPAAAFWRELAAASPGALERAIGPRLR
jgi:hypothetical protein